MAKKYLSPVLLAGGEIGHNKSEQGNVEDESIRNMKDDISSSFVYGDDNYEEEYIVPNIVEEIVPADSRSEEAGE